eukprot:3263375-Pleurochrysis_carterae.AAC.1
MPMTSTVAARLFALGRAHDVRAGASREDTRAGVILGHPDDTAAWMRESADGEEEWKLLRKRAWQGLKLTMLLEKRKAAGLAQGDAQRQARRKARKARCEGHRARASMRCRLPSTTLTCLFYLMGINSYHHKSTYINSS